MSVPPRSASHARDPRHSYRYDSAGQTEADWAIDSHSWRQTGGRGEERTAAIRHGAEEEEEEERAGRGGAGELYLVWF